MPDHATMGVEIHFFDWWWFPDEGPERWNTIRAEIEQAAQEVLARNGLTPEQYEIVPTGA